MQSKPAWMVVVTGLALSACSPARMYPGPPLPGSKVAIVKGSRMLGGVRIYFAGIDSEGNEFSAAKIEVNSGKLRLTVHYYDESRAAAAIRRTLSFHALGGHTYQVKALEHGTVWIWIEDSRSGEVVGGRRP
ncbi:MAG: hypothetical protein ACE5EO_03915 [Candidatus Krumholzibacteriia bacterium]